MSKQLYVLRQRLGACDASVACPTHISPRPVDLPSLRQSGYFIFETIRAFLKRPISFIKAAEPATHDANVLFRLGARVGKFNTSGGMRKAR